jgi:putative ABC transport system permease protein
VRRLSAANLVKRPVRTSISVLAVALGAAVGLVLVGMTEGSLNEVTRRMQQADADLIYHARGYDLVTDFSAPLDEREGEKLRELFDGIDYALPVFVDRIFHLNRGHNVFGIRPGDFDRVAHGLGIVRGRLFRDATEMVVDERIAREGKIEPGKVLSVRGREFTVTGVAREGVPVRFMVDIEALQQIEGQPGRATFFFVKAKDPEKTADLGRSIEERLKSRQVVLLGNYYQTLSGSFRGLHQFIFAMVVVSSGISFLVVLLAMYTTVIERTREIGILKAIGASQGFIMGEVFCESMMICAAGVMLALVLAAATGAMLTALIPQITVELTLKRTLSVAVLALAAGALGALYPAAVAARSDPVQALAWE